MHIYESELTMQQINMYKKSQFKVKWREKNQNKLFQENFLEKILLKNVVLEKFQACETFQNFTHLNFITTFSFKLYKNKFFYFSNIFLRGGNSLNDVLVVLKI